MLNERIILGAGGQQTKMSSNYPELLTTSVIITRLPW